MARKTHTARFTSPPVVGRPAEVVAEGPGYSGVVTTGTYVGVAVDEEDGIARHMFRGGIIGSTPQGDNGLHGIPVDHFADGQQTTAVQTIIDKLTAAGLSPEWHHTGGGCMAVRLWLSETDEVLVVDYEGPLDVGDLTSDEGINGWYVGRYHEGSPVGEDDGYVYASPVDDEGYQPTSDIDEVVAAVVAETTREA